MSSDRWVSTQRAFTSAAAWFVQMVPAAVGHWDDPALGTWTVRDLVGHTSRALLTIESYLHGDTTDLVMASPIDYYLVGLAFVDHEAVAQRGREAGLALGEDPVGEVATIAERVFAAVAGSSEGTHISLPAGAIRLIDYLPTRTLELTVHTCDLARALHQPLEVPEAAAKETLTLIGGLAARGKSAGDLLLAVTGRRALPDGFTVL